ncbi:MAG: hypothetical protein IPO49_15865 [Bacteroidetes bacterium]|nr:hypothetical protein [Bacteroidota bacterium]
MVAFEAKRYGNFNGAYSMENWHINCREPPIFPALSFHQKRCHLGLKDGDFTRFKMEIKDIEYNQQGLFPGLIFSPKYFSLLKFWHQTAFSGIPEFPVNGFSISNSSISGAT